MCSGKASTTDGNSMRTLNNLLFAEWYVQQYRNPLFKADFAVSGDDQLISMESHHIADWLWMGE